MPILMFTANSLCHATSSEKRGRPRSQSAPAVLRSQKKQKQKKRKQLSEESMVAAIDAIKGGENVLRAAKQFGVPRQTVGDRVAKWQSCSWHETRTKVVSNVGRRE